MALDEDRLRSHLRSHLYVPGRRSDHVAKAYASTADAVVLELEDGVAPTRKDAARRTIAEVLDDGPSKPTFVRINPIGSAELEADVSAIADRPVAGLRVPKVESVGGFVGRSAIHPSQRSTINSAYTPDPDEVAAAEALARRFEASVSEGEGGMRTPDGRFVDRAVIRAARRASSGERNLP